MWHDLKQLMLCKEREVFDFNIGNIIPLFGLILFNFYYRKIQTHAEVEKIAITQRPWLSSSQSQISSQFSCFPKCLIFPLF